ncbi:MAG: hypothetical protein V3S89_12490 [Desulfobacterales bacterium]
MKYSRQSRCDRIILRAIVFLLVVAPFASGAAKVSVYSLIEIAVFLLAVFWLADKLIASKAVTIEWVRAPVNLFLVMLVVFSWLQLIPLPAVAIRFLSPQLYADRLQLFDIMARSADSVVSLPFWMVPVHYLHPVLVGNLKLTACVGIYFLILNTVRSKKQIDMLVYVLIVTGLLQAIFGIFQRVSITGSTWALQNVVWGPDLIRGSLHGSEPLFSYLSMGFLLTLGLMVAHRKRSGRIESGLKSGRASVQRIVARFSPDSIRPKTIFLLFAVILMGTGLVLSASRVGMLSFGAAMFLTALVLFAGKELRSYGTVVLCLCGLAVGYGISLPIDSAGRLGWSGAWAKIGVSGAIVIIALGVYLVLLFRVWRRRGDSYALGIGAGVMACVLNAGIHALFGSGIPAPANVLTLAALLGLGYMAVYRQGRGPSESFFFHVGSVRMTLLQRGIAVGVILILSGAGIFAAGRHYLAEASFPTEGNAGKALDQSSLKLRTESRIGRERGLARRRKGAKGRRIQQPGLSEIERAIAWNPYNAAYHFLRAEALKGEGRRQKAEGIRGGRRTEGSRLRLKTSPRQGGDKGRPSPRLPTPLNELRGTGRPASRGQVSVGELVVKHSRFGDPSATSTSSGIPSGSGQEGKGGGQPPAHRGLRPGGRTEDGGQTAAIEERDRPDGIIESLERAVGLNPRRGIYWYELGQQYARRDDDPFSYLNRWLPLAEDCFDNGLRYAPEDPDMLLRVAGYWVWRSSILTGKEEKRSAIDRFQEYYRRALMLKIADWEKAVDRVWEYYPDDAVAMAIVPKDQEELRHRVLKYLAKKG